jgi:hypothetical protein
MLKTFSFGGGRQSMAVLVLASQGKLNYDAFLFSNVGDDAENPDTIKYFNEYALPFAEKHKLNLKEIHRIPKKGRNKGNKESLYQNLILENRRTIEIPILMKNGAFGRRGCTHEFKIKVVGKWQKRNGATKDNPAITGIGISLDEYKRARNKAYYEWQILEYPLLDLRLTRDDCIKIIKESGLPVPPKSACWFCPFHSFQEWIELKKKKPELFQKAIDLEILLNKRRETLNKDEIFLTKKLVPLDKAFDNQLELFDDVELTCDTGHCFV